MGGTVNAVAEARRTRPKGAESRERILDAAAAIAGERGFEGTSISLISERSGLPASSVYWHFKDKDELIAAVIDRSFGQWTDALSSPMLVSEGTTDEERFHLSMQRTGAAIAKFPDYLRLGLMLILERRPEEPTARGKFIEVRHVASDRARVLYTTAFADLTAADVESLVTITMALADGLFIAQEVDEVVLSDVFDLVATAVLGAADQLRSTRRPRPTPSKATKPRVRRR
jgi:AcrR family transcriptional regulator